MPGEYTAVLEPADPTPVPVEPVAQPVPGAPVPEAIPEVPVGVETTTAPILYDLPDGRKVDAATLQREWKDNFLPDYTRKSQELATYRKPAEAPVAPVPAWKEPGYTPASYDELIELGAQEAVARMENSRRQEEQQKQEVTARVDQQLTELKHNDPGLDENAFFAHATKYGFTDVKLAHENYRFVRDAVSQAEARAIQNAQTRAVVPVAPPAGVTPVSNDTIDPAAIGRFGSAREYLASLTGN